MGPAADHPSSQASSTAPAAAVTPVVPAPAPAPLPNPLRSLHAEAGAEFQDYANVEIVSTFGEPQAEYAAVRKACALFDLPQRGILELTGKDRLPFLNNLLTNQTWDKATKSPLAGGQGVYAFLLNKQGRIFTDMNVIERGERTLLELDARLVEPLRLALDKYLFIEKVQLTGRVGSLHAIALHGPGAAAVLDAAVGSHVPELPPLGSTEVSLFGVDGVTVWRDDPCGVPGYLLLLPAEQAAMVWSTLLSRFGELVGHARRPLRPAGWAVFNTTRIEADRPMFGIDFDESVLPAETGPAMLSRAVSFTKGCYVGQEVVARMHARKQVARQLVGLRLEDDSLPVAGAPLSDDAGNTVGGVTSSTISPVLSRAAICLGYLKKPFFEEGTVVHVPAEGEMRKAKVVKTPFL
jgi:folate-binding protein YgfZ